MPRTFLNTEAFYDADPRRRTSGEVDYGVWWRDRASFLTYRVSYVTATGELYAVCLQHGPVELLCSFPDRDACDRALNGWPELCGLDGSIDWIRRRALLTGAPLP